MGVFVLEIISIHSLFTIYVFLLIVCLLAIYSFKCILFIYSYVFLFVYFFIID